MSTCQSECDCGNPSIKYYGPHEPDCHWWTKCDEGRYCDKHFEEAAAENAKILRSVIGNCGGSTYAETEAQMRQDIIDAGRGHLVRP